LIAAGGWNATGAHFSEMWRLDLRTFQWRPVQYATSAPLKRALHAAAIVGDAMYVQGGLELSDTWRYDMPTRTWKALAVGQAQDANHPGRRHAHDMAEGVDCVFVFGGGRHGGGMRPQGFNDLYRYSFAADAWALITPASAAIPGPRSHLSFLALSSKALMTYGGALCVPGCKCYGDAWIFDLTTNEWSAVNFTDVDGAPVTYPSPAIPIHRYRQSFMLNDDDGALYLFGGESYQPYMYHNAVDKLVLSGEKLTPLLAASDGELRGKGKRKGRGGRVRARYSR